MTMTTPISWNVWKTSPAQNSSCAGAVASQWRRVSASEGMSSVNNSWGLACSIIDEQCQYEFIGFIDSNIHLTTMTSLHNTTQTPAQRRSEIPIDSIIRQVATPSPFPQPAQTLPPQQAYLAPPQQVILPPQQVLAPNQQLLVPQQPLLLSGSQPLQSFSGSSRLLQTAQFVGGPNQQIQKEVTIAGGQLPPVVPIRRVQYVPYEQRYIEYVEQRIKVPVQKVATDFYQIEHITDYMPIEKEEVVYELQPQEVVTMRLQYVPVEQKIIHISDKNAQVLGIKEYVSTATNQEVVTQSPLYKVVTVNGPNVVVEKGLEKSGVSSIRKSRTNFVTSEGYDPQANLQQIDNLLSASGVRGSRARQP